MFPDDNHWLSSWVFIKVGILMFQTNIYEFIDIQSDPILIKLTNLELGQCFNIQPITVCLNKHGIYEVETNQSHDSFSDCMSCYRHVCMLIENQEIYQ